MSDERTRWTALADELGFTFNPGARGVLDSKLAPRIAAQHGQDPAQIAAVEDHSMIMAVLDQVIFGVATGAYRGYDFFVYPNTPRSASDTPSPPSVHVQLFFPASAEMGLSIYRERFWSKVGKFLGAQDIQTGHAELDPLVMIKAKEKERAQQMLAEAPFQEALLTLFRGSDDFEVDDEGIEHRTRGQRFLPANVVRPLMDRMVAAAEVMRPGLGI